MIEITEDTPVITIVNNFYEIMDRVRTKCIDAQDYTHNAWIANKLDGTVIIVLSAQHNLAKYHLNFIIEMDADTSCAFIVRRSIAVEATSHRYKKDETDIMYAVDRSVTLVNMLEYKTYLLPGELNDERILAHAQRAMSALHDEIYLP